LVSQLLSLNPDIIVLRGTPEALAVKNATSTIPVVMSANADPIGAGVAVSLSRPGGNFTGMSSVVRQRSMADIRIGMNLSPRGIV
jgi:putative ABC transport system substrate-binding protein